LTGFQTQYNESFPKYRAVDQYTMGGDSPGEPNESDNAEDSGRGPRVGISGMLLCRSNGAVKP
jgi:hypothetical protein